MCAFVPGVVGSENVINYSGNANCESYDLCTENLASLPIEQTICRLRTTLNLKFLSTVSHILAHSPDLMIGGNPLKPVATNGILMNSSL
jgi:hypothetical protein